MSRFPNPKTKISSLCSYKIKLNLYSLKRDGWSAIHPISLLYDNS